MLQIAAPEAMRGRISALLMLNPAFISLGALVAGPLSDAVGVRHASAILAAAAIGDLLPLAERRLQRVLRRLALGQRGGK